MTAERPVFYLIDGHAVAYRQFHALRATGFSTSSGEPTNAVFGFTRLLLDIIQKEKPDYLAVSFDRGLSDRDALYPDYKGTREKMPDDLRTQMERIFQVVQAFNIPVLAVDGYEADDVIGTVSRQAVAQGVDVHIITGDRDILQLLEEHVTVQLPSRGGPDETFDIPAFQAKYGLDPTQLVDLKALMGDSSDNIPGVKGIGQKGATTLLQTYGTLDGVYADVENITGSTGKKLAEGRELAYISQELAQIQCDVPITWALADCVSHDFDPAKPLAIFRELELRSLTKRLGQLAEEGDDEGDDEAGDSIDDGDSGVLPRAADVVDTVIVRDEAGLAELVETLTNAKSIVFDVETTSTDQMSAELVGIALAVNGKRGYYVPVGHKPAGQQTLFPEDAEQQIELDRVLEALRAPLTDPTIPKVAHNAAYDLVVMRRYGIDVTPIAFDTMIAEWLRDPISKFLGLKNFARQYLNVEMTEITDLIGTGRNQKSMAEVSVDDAGPYAAADGAITHRAYTLLRESIGQEGLIDLYNELEMPLVPVIGSMEQAGIVLDTPYLADMSERLAELLHALEQEIYSLSGGYGTFNINSPKQLNDVLFGKLGLPVKNVRKTSHGYSTDAATLETLAGEHEIVRQILNYRELSKLKGTYVDALPALVNAETGRLHTSYNQTGTSTGRLSSSNPNLQNIPIRTEIGREVRRAFIAPPGRTLLSVDYSQIELRVMAHISQDETLLDAFAHDLDIHAATAATVNGIPLEEVTYEQRSFAKRVNFGLMYGMGAFRLARDSDLTRSEAQRFIETYFERMPRVREYIDSTKKLAADQGFLTTLFGRKRFFRALQNERSGGQARQAEERAAINMPIQGTAADIMKRAMIDLHHELAKRKSSALMVLQVHDELVLDVAENEAADTAALVVSVMEGAYELDAPLKANAEIGPNWRDMDPVAR
jgi:DNA polymerase-1